MNETDRLYQEFEGCPVTPLNVTRLLGEVNRVVALRMEERAAIVARERQRARPLAVVAWIWGAVFGASLVRLLQLGGF